MGSVLSVQVELCLSLVVCCLGTAGKKVVITNFCSGRFMFFLSALLFRDCLGLRWLSLPYAGRAMFVLSPLFFRGCWNLRLLSLPSVREKQWFWLMNYYDACSVIIMGHLLLPSYYLTCSYYLTRSCSLTQSLAQTHSLGLTQPLICSYSLTCS